MDTNALEETINALSEVVSGATTYLYITETASISSDYSRIVGFDQLGASHGGTIAGAKGSANEVLKSFAEQIEWLGGALVSSAKVLNTQNAFATRGMEIADEGGSTGEQVVAFPQRPDVRYDDFDFPRPFIMKASSLAELGSALFSTKYGDAAAAATSWEEMGTKIATVSETLRQIAGQIEQSNRGIVFDQAVAKINEVASHGEAFAANTKVFVNSLMGMIDDAVQLQLPVMTARAAIAAIQDPVEKRAAEEAYLTKFQAVLQRNADAAVPSISNLMSNASVTATGGAGVGVGMNDIAGRGRLSTAGLQAVTLEGAGTGGQVSGGGQFAAVQENTGQLAGINPTGLDTHAASLGNTSLAAAPSALGATSPMVGAGNLGASTIGAGSNSLGDGPSMAGVGLAGTHSRGGHSALAGRVGGPGALGGPHGLNAGGRGSLAGGPIAGARGTGIGVGGGTAPMNPGIGSAPGHIGAPGQAGSSKNAGGVGGARGAGPLMGGMPMSAAADGQQRKGKVRQVTSSLESEGNIKALIGEREPVVPGVIGSWIRD